MAPPVDAPPAERAPWWLGLVVVAAVCLAYANSLSAPFVFDDLPSVTENPTIRQLSWAMFSPPPGTGLTVDGRPVLNVSLALNYAVSGASVRGYHVTNVAIHALAALTLFGLVRRTLLRLRSGQTLAPHATELALATALLWALHPLQTESVTYVVQRTESLMGLFYLLTLYAFVRGCTAAPARGWFTVAVIACTLGMATKEVMVSAPLIVLLYDRTFVAGSFRAAWQQRRGLYLALAATWLLLAYLVVGTGLRGGTIGAAAGVTPWDYALSQSRAILHYLWLTLWPRALVFDYGSDFVTFAQALPFALLDLALLGGTAWALVRRPALGFLGAWFFAILAPTSSILGGTRQMLAEHRIYLSLAAVAVLVAVVLRLALGRRNRLAWSALAVLLGLLTVRRNEDYRSVLALYQDTVAKRPQNAYAHNNLGQALLLAGRYAEAVASFQTALPLSPNRTLAHNYLAGALARLGRTAESVEHARAALTFNPTYAEARFNLGTGLLRLGQFPAAVAELETALRLQPDYAEAACNLGTALLQTGRAADAIPRYETALRFKPDYAEAHYSLALARHQLGQWPAALASYTTALQLRPDYPEAHNNFGVALRRVQRTAEALDHFRAAVRARPDYAEAFANLGNALLESNRLPEAIPPLQTALRLAPSNIAAHFDLGNALATSGRAPEAIPHFEAAVRAFPDNPEYRNNLGGALLEGSTRLDDAITHFTAALRLKPSSPETHCNLGLALADRGQRADAIRHLEEALRLRPDYPFARAELVKLRAAPSR